MLLPCSSAKISMEASSKASTSAASSPYSSPNLAALLKIRVISWSQETGLPVAVRVRLGDRTFSLHKYPFFSKSGYFQKRLNESNELELPQEFPGGPEAFEQIALFVYGSSTIINPFNVANLRCAAEFLEMKEEYCIGNLCERFDLYLNQVVLQSWDDTLIVLQKCQMLLPWTEELLIVSRCIESLAFMACMEILDPEGRRERPTAAIDALAGKAWSCGTAASIVSKELWIKDLIALPLAFFKRIIGSLRRQGMKEKYVTPIIIFYANKWVLSSNIPHLCEEDASNELGASLQDVVDLLPLREKPSKLVPVGFFFALLARSLEFVLRNNSRMKLQRQITCMLHLSQVDDFLLPKNATDLVTSTKELTAMQDIFSSYVSVNVDRNQTPSASNSIVADLWDTYLKRIASHPDMNPKRFMELIEIVPMFCRQSHDQLYRAINTFLQVHRDISQEEKGAVCKYLSCKRMSQEACIEAVQNELMPLRLIVQALFIQQLNTHQAFKECSDSFRYSAPLSGSLSSSRCPNLKSLNLCESPYTDEPELGSRPLSCLLQNEFTGERYELSRKDYESTSFRLQSLEQELMCLKRSLQRHNVPKKSEPVSSKTYGLERRSLSKRRNPVGRVTACIGTMNFAAQRNYASRLLTVLHRFSLFGSRKSKRKAVSSNLS